MRGEKSHLRRFSVRLQALYSNWRRLQSREWMGAKLIVLRAPPSYCPFSYLPYIEPDQESLRFFEWLFGEEQDDLYIVLSLTEIYVVCGSGCFDGSYQTKLLSPFADEAKQSVGVDFVLKAKSTGRTLRQALVEMAGGFRRPVPPPGVKGKGKDQEKVTVGFIGENAPELELEKWMEWKNVTDAFCRMAGFK